MGKWTDLAHGKQSCSFCTKKWKLSQIRSVDTGSKVVVNVCQECIAAGHDITHWPIDPYYDSHEE
jgi:hypothetical protein